jgi:hypothetical protein
MPHAWLLAAHADARARRPAEALALAKQIERVSSNRADALDVLAVSHAAVGDFTAAVETANAALAAAPANRSELRLALLERIALYRSKQPFVLKR